MSSLESGLFSPSAPILRGKLKGKRWLLASRGKLLRVLLSTYEREQTRLFEDALSPGNVVFDIGAHAGYYSLLASVLVGSSGSVFAFEPEPRNALYLKKHMAINRCGNVTVVESAVGNNSGMTHFEYGTGSGTGRVATARSDGDLAVPMVSLDDFTESNAILPDHLKIDVEGAEMLVLQGARRTISRARPVIFLSTHGPAVHRECCRFLKELQYELRAILGDALEAAAEILCVPRHR